jgi:hypothetical protein
VEDTGPANPFLFAGREYDPEMGLYYMRALLSKINRLSAGIGESLVFIGFP